ncbi:MAG: signal recognition particle-docking protein FtsY, partial [Polyangia bacterium]
PMDPSSFHLSPAELYELIGVVGGLGVTGTLGVLFVRRARASRRRQIEEAGDGPPALGREERSAKPARTRDQAPEPRPEPEPRGRERGAAAPARAPEPRAPEARPLPAPSRDAERPGQVIPFPAPEPQPEPAPKKRANALAPGLARTRSGFVARLGAVFTGRKQIDPAVVDEIEKVLLTADIGVKTSQKLLEEIRSSLSRSELKDPDAVWAFLRQRSTEMLSLPAPDVDFGSAKPFVLLVIGVNGSGKTTTIGKLSARLAGEGKKVLMAAGDTFRAAAAEQLEVWAGRTGAAIVRGKEGADPSSVIFDGIKRAATEGFDVAITDTAGRLHTKTDLMQELQKVRRVVGKAAPGAPHETWLVIDSTSGQNAIAQAQIFTEAMAVSGIVLTKLDGTAKGGVILGIADQLKIPVRYVGIGESVEDLRPFDPTEFVEALFAPLET